MQRWTADKFVSTVNMQKPYYIARLSVFFPVIYLYLAWMTNPHRFLGIQISIDNNTVPHPLKFIDISHRKFKNLSRTNINHLQRTYAFDKLNKWSCVCTGSQSHHSRRGTQTTYSKTLCCILLWSRLESKDHLLRWLEQISTNQMWKICLTSHERFF